MRAAVADRSALAVVLAVVLPAILGCSQGDMSDRDDVIEYRGEWIKLSHAYSDYDDFKNDPNNIDPTEIARVQRLVSQSPIARSFNSREEMSDAVSDLKFPGYGQSDYAPDAQPDGSTLELSSIEIPQADKEARTFASLRPRQV